MWIDGTAQYDSPVELASPSPAHRLPDETLGDIVERTSTAASVIFTGIHREPARHARARPRLGRAELQRRRRRLAEARSASAPARRPSRRSPARNVTTVALRNGHITPSIIAFGSSLGLNAIDAEATTDNGPSSGVFSRAIDGLALDTKKLHQARRHGVTRAVSAPGAGGFGGVQLGVSVGFLTGAATPAEGGAVIADDVAVHYTLAFGGQAGQHAVHFLGHVGALRRKLLDAVAGAQRDRCPGRTLLRGRVPAQGSQGRGCRSR